MLNINIEEVESVLLEKHFDPVKVAEVIKELEEIAEEVAAEKEKEAAEIPDEDGLPADIGAGDLPKTKWEYVILLNDKEGYLKDKEIAGWVVQQEENADAGLVLQKLRDAAKDQNERAKRKKNTITTLEDLFDGLKAKFLKSKNIKIKTKDLTRVIVSNGKF
jgi:hypothetical protein